MKTDDFFLVEEFDRHELPNGDEVVLPVKDRKPTDPGFVLTWKERRRRGGRGYDRTGMVLARAPEPDTVWAVPDKRRRGEGYAVVVKVRKVGEEVVAFRVVGEPGDYRSTARWQAPGQLPRALLRTDLFTNEETGYQYEMTRLHTDASCSQPMPLRMLDEPEVWAVQRGEARRLEDVYVYDGHIHSASVLPTAPPARPVTPAGPTVDISVRPWIDGQRAIACGGCLSGLPPT